MATLSWCDECGEFFPVDDHFHGEHEDYAAQAQTELVSQDLHQKRQEAVQAMYNLLRRDLEHDSKLFRPWHAYNDRERLAVRFLYEDGVAGGVAGGLATE